MALTSSSWQVSPINWRTCGGSLSVALRTPFRMRQANARRDQNRRQRSTLRGAIKKVRGATTREGAAQAYAAAERLLDRAAGKGLIHHNAAARQKSRLLKAVRGKG